MEDFAESTPVGCDHAVARRAGSYKVRGSCRPQGGLLQGSCTGTAMLAVLRVDRAAFDFHLGGFVVVRDMHLGGLFVR